MAKHHEIQNAFHFEVFLQVNLPIQFDAFLIVFSRNKFGELFYRIIIMSFKNHPKGLIVETALLLDPNRENYKDIMNKLQEQVSKT